MIEIEAIPSKSFAHRALICAMLSLAAEGGAAADASKPPFAGSYAEAEKLAPCGLDSDDVLATKACVRALMEGEDRLCCRESGSTLRFLIPVAAALGRNVTFVTEGRLSERPLGALSDALAEHGVTVSTEGDLVKVAGVLAPGKFRLPGNISSQFITGLLLAAPVLSGRTEIVLTTELKSKKYVDITIEVMRAFGAAVERTAAGFAVGEAERYTAPEAPVVIEGDWSNAAFFLAAGAVGEAPVAVKGLDPDSAQGDREICRIIEAFGGRIEREETPDGTRVVSYPADLRAAPVDVSDVPDLAPPVAALAAAAEGMTKITGTARLRAKESDRVASIVSALSETGIGAYDADDAILITGAGKKHGAENADETQLLPVGGEVDSRGDHRIAMLGALLSLLAGGTVRVTGASAVRKSYPDFFRVFADAGLSGNLETDL